MVFCSIRLISHYIITSLGVFFFFLFFVCVRKRGGEEIYPFKNFPFLSLLQTKWKDVLTIMKIQELQI